MKRSLFIAIVVLLMAALFVSCNADKAMEDQLFEVTVDGGARTLEASGVLDVDVENLVWFYEATKTSGGFKYGQTTGKTPVKADYSAGLTGESIGSFSKGAWLYKFYGYATTDVVSGAIAEGAEPVFQQLNCTATIAADYVLSVTLERGEGALPAAIVKFGTLNWFHEHFKGEENHNLSLKIFVEGETTPRIDNIGGNWIAADGKATFDTTASITLTEASTLSFRVYEGDDIIGTENIPIAAIPGMTYTVNVTGDDSGITPVHTEYGVTIDVVGTAATLPVTTDTSVSVKSSVSPDNTLATAATTVTFPAGSFTAAQATATENATLSINVKNVEEASSATFAVVGANDTAIGAISLNLAGVDTSNFGEAVTIETYIAKNLNASDINVIYNGAGDPPTDKTYDPETGRLTFKTTHFSEYVIVSGEAVAFNADTKAVYTSLQAAIDAAQAGQTIKLLKDVSTTSYIAILGSVILDGNNHSIEFSANRGIRIGASDVVVELHNLTLKAKSGYSQFERAIQVDSNKTGVSLVIDNCTAIATMYTINFCADTTVLMEMTNSTMTGWAALNAYGTGNVITIDNCTLNGLNDKSLSSWNNFATICLEGDTTGETDLHSADYVITISNSRVTATQTTGNMQFVLGFNNNALNSSVTFINTEFEVGEGCYFFYDKGNGNSFSIDNEVYYPVAKIDTKGYLTLADAIAAVPAENTEAVTITLQRDAKGAGIKLVATDKKNIVIDLAGHTYTVGTPVGSTGTETQGWHLEKGNTVTIKNGTLNVDSATTPSNFWMLLQNYCDLTLDNVVLDGRGLNSPGSYTSSNNCGTVVYTNGTKIIAKDGGVAFDVCWGPKVGYPTGTQVSIADTCTVVGPIEIGTWGEDDTTIESILSTLTVSSEKFDAQIINGNTDFDLTKVEGVWSLKRKTV